MEPVRRSIPASHEGDGGSSSSSFPRRVTILDTAVASTNLGDQIIMEAVRQELSQLIPDALPFSVATHEWLGAKSRSLICRSDWAITGGTNLLSSRMWLRPLWKLAPWDARIGRRIILMGAGWYQHQRQPDPYTRWLLGSVLSASCIHSVRDSYAEGMLHSIGISNVLNTGCPTIWSLTPERCDVLPTNKGSSVVTTLNTYMPDAGRDRELLTTLRRQYQKVYFWPQSDSDAAYARDFGFRLDFVDPTLQAYDRLLAGEPDLDYVGLRLHGGIRALQHGRRSIIVEIDNRAAVMGSDHHLPTVKQGDWNRLRHLISHPFETRITVPRESISLWKQQFQRPARKHVR